MIKLCTKCKIEKDISLFFKQKDTRDGFQTYCKKCHMKVTRLWRDKNPDKYKIYCSREGDTPEKLYKAKMRLRKNRKEMSDSYIRMLITMNCSLTGEDIPDEMVEMYKMNLELKRILNLTPKLKGEEEKP